MPPFAALLIMALGFAASFPHQPSRCHDTARIVAVEHREAWTGMSVVVRVSGTVDQTPLQHDEVWVAVYQYQDQGVVKTGVRSFFEEVQVGGGFPVECHCPPAGAGNGGNK